MTENRPTSLQLNIRIRPDLEDQLLEIARYEHEDRLATLARRLLHEAAERRLLEIALKEYGEGRVTGSWAAKMARMTLSRFQDEAANRGISTPYTREEVLEEIKAAVQTFRRRNTSFHLPQS